MAYLALRVVFATWAWLSLLLPTSHAQSLVHPEGTELFACPSKCSCQKNIVDCSRKGLTRIPLGLPLQTQKLDLEGNRIASVTYTDLSGLDNLRSLNLGHNEIHSMESRSVQDLRKLEKLDLQGNHLSGIFYSDLSGLSNLRILQLHDNRIHTIERGAFHDLRKLERLRLDRNKLQHLPDHLFTNSPNLYKLELSHNSLKIIGKKMFKGLSQLRYLLLDDNQINCVDEQAFEGLEYLEILTLTNNNITTLWRGTFEATPRLRALRVSGNKLICDCHLAWLGRWLAAAPHLAPYIRCFSPYRLKDRLVTDVLDHEFKCTGLVDRVERGCSLAPVCPRACRCGGGIVDCRDTGQTHVPSQIPDDTIELRLEHNEITHVPEKAFASYQYLKRIDLSNNEISEIADNAFLGIKSLNSLVLYGNKISAISSKVFRGLSNLQLLLLNANQIGCVHKDSFKDLKNLNLLSLYDNQIMSLSNGTFTPLTKIQTMHLGSNPFVCDCHLGWLARYLSINPIETSGARCKEPVKMSRKPLGRLKGEGFRCTNELRSKYSGRCGDEVPCPDLCLCDGSRVDCSGRDLTFPPKNIPNTVTHLDLSYNQMTTLETERGLRDLSAFKDLRSLDLSHNRLVTLSSAFFRGTKKLASLGLSHNSLVSIGGNVLQKVAHLFHLDLAENHISCLSKEILEYIPQIKTLDLTGNPLRCDCRLRWLTTWLDAHPSVPVPKCQLPESFLGTPITKVPKAQMECSESALSEGCAGAQFCPPDCQCLKGVVRCSRGRLTDIPKGIPPDTTELYLDVNEIKSINPSRIKHLKALKRLDFSNNQVSILPNNTFKELGNLATLGISDEGQKKMVIQKTGFRTYGSFVTPTPDASVISYNKLGCIERDALMGLKSLRILSLHGNDVSYIPEGAFRDLQSLSHIALGANPLYCDCSLAWLAKWVKNDYVEPGIAKCADPRPMRDKLILTTPPAMFHCKEKVPDEVFAKCDLCYTHPCRNGGSCVSMPGREYECLCPPGFHGSECQYKIDACYGNPCVNGGTCKVFETGRFACHCSPGFEGERCEININDCANHKCGNGGTCVDGINSYSCSCPQGFTGEYCERVIAFCSKEFNPCQNGAVCKDEGKKYSCVCSRGWSGVNCTHNIDDCATHICQNGGQCVDGIGTYECKCIGDWSGRFCELGPSVLQQTEPCLQHDCHHGVCVVPRGKSEYVCKCLPGYSGKYCEYQTTVSFVDKKSFLQMNAPSMKNPVNLTMSFTTGQSNGVLLYLGEAREHLAVELFQKRIRISFDCGNRPTSVMFSYEVVSNEKEHTVELQIESHNITLRIDRGKARRMTNRGESPHLDAKTPLFVGGVPQDIAVHALRYWHLRNSTSFIGCLNQIIINGKVQDLAKSEKQNKVVPGCGDAEQHDQGQPNEITMKAAAVGVVKNEKLKNVCDGHKCENGKCRPRRDKKGYRCRCNKGFGGRFCNKPPTCQKESEKAFVYDYGCRSRRPVRQFRCEGSCGQQCCRPKRYRTKKVAMICNDGTKFIKKVDIVRKCRCLRKCGEN